MYFLLTFAYGGTVLDTLYTLQQQPYKASIRGLMADTRKQFHRGEVTCSMPCSWEDWLTSLVDSQELAHSGLNTISLSGWEAIWNDYY
jgi:hypothetical protein